MRDSGDLSASMRSIQRKLAVYIFSYNRGRWLDHVLSTTKQCMSEFDVFVVDDNSNDAETCDVLRRWDGDVDILSPGGELSERKTGGLYRNMSVALEHSLSGGYEFALFTQDDMQFVRKFEEQDAKAIFKYFNNHERSIQLCMHFIKPAGPGEHLDEKWRMDAGGQFLIRSDTGKGKTNFAAPGVFHLARTKNVLGKFRKSEIENSNELRRKGYYFATSVFPLICYMPAPRSYRGQRRSLEHRFYELLGGAGFHPVAIMSQREVKRFWERDLARLPIAEDFLKCPTAPAAKNWAAGGGAHLVLARGGWRARIFHSVAGIKKAVKFLIGYR